MTSASDSASTFAALTNTQALKALRLPSMSRSWQELAMEATEHAWTHERFLAALCRLELAERGNRRLAAPCAPPICRLVNGSTVLNGALLRRSRASA